MSDPIRFTVPAGHAFAKCVEKTTNRYGNAMASALLARNAGQSYVLACNGRILAAVPVDVADDHKPMLLPAAAVSSNGKAASVEVNGEVRTTVGAKTTVAPMPLQEGRWPNLSQIFPDSTAGYTQLVIDADLLHTLASAIAADGILTLLIPPAGNTMAHEKPLVAIGHDADMTRSALGLICPLSSGKAMFISESRAFVEEHVKRMPPSITFDAAK